MAIRRCSFSLVLSSFLVAAGLVTLFFVPAADLLAQDAEPPAKSKQDPYEKILTIKDWKYLPPKGPNGKQAVQFKLDLHPDIPKGAKINLQFEYQALPLENPTDLVVKDNRRAGVAFTWTFKERLAIDEYHLRVRMYLERQTPAVQKKLRALSKKFPLEHQPWPWYYHAKPIRIGTDEELAAEEEAICDAYDQLVGSLIDNMAEFVETMDAVKEGKKFVSDGSVDEAKLTAFIVEWRKKQGETQKAIRTFSDTNLAYFQKTKTAHYLLQQLGQMVSKRSLSLQGEATKEYGVGPLNPASSPDFDRSSRVRTVKRRHLRDKLTRITDLTCPLEEEEEPAEPEAAGGDAAGTEAVDTDAAGTDKKGAGAKKKDARTTASKGK